MPIYDYRCDHCGHAFSAVQSFKDEPLTACPSCGKHPRRLLSKPAIVFKGSGWYITDSRGSSSTTTASSDGDKSADKPADKGERSEKKDTKSAETTSSSTEKTSSS